MFLTRKRSVKRTSRVHLWKSAKSFKSPKRSTFVRTRGCRTSTSKEKAILIESHTMGKGQKGVCVRDKSLSFGQKLDGASVSCGALFVHCICWRPPATRLLRPHAVSIKS